MNSRTRTNTYINKHLISFPGENVHILQTQTGILYTTKDSSHELSKRRTAQHTHVGDIPGCIRPLTAMSRGSRDLFIRSHTHKHIRTHTHYLIHISPHARGEDATLSAEWTLQVHLTINHMLHIRRRRRRQLRQRRRRRRRLVVVVMLVLWRRWWWNVVLYAPH